MIRFTRALVAHAVLGAVFLAGLASGPVRADDPLADDIVRSLTGGNPAATRGLTRSLKTRGIAVDEAVRMEPRPAQGAIAATPPMPTSPAPMAMPAMSMTVMPGGTIAPSLPVATTAATGAVPALGSYDLYVTFPSGSAELTYEARLKLRSLARALSDARLAGSHIRIAGHTDARGSDAMNLALSLRRAESVRGHLLFEYGIEPGRLETIGFGERRLKDRARPAAEINRRVEIINLGR